MVFGSVESLHFIPSMADRQDVDGNSSGKMACSLAAEIQSNPCPICFELMASPEYTPMLLSPCGHTFCAKCLEMHTIKNRRTFCPYCRQTILAQTVNLSLKRLIDSFVQTHKQPFDIHCKDDVGRACVDRDSLSEKLEQAETRYRIMQIELIETMEEEDKLESDLAECDRISIQLQTKETEIKENLRKMALENMIIMSEIQNNEMKRDGVKNLKNDITAKISMIQSTLADLDKECEKLKLLSIKNHTK